MTITLELEPEAAAGLKRFAEKITHELASSVLYPHVNPNLRIDQSYHILAGFAVLERALGDAGISSHPWIETGSAK